MSSDASISKIPVRCFEIDRSNRIGRLIVDFSMYRQAQFLFLFLFLRVDFIFLDSRDVREWLATFPFPSHSHQFIPIPNSIPAMLKI